MTSRTAREHIQDETSSPMVRTLLFFATVAAYLRRHVVSVDMTLDRLLERYLKGRTVHMMLDLLVAIH